MDSVTRWKVLTLGPLGTKDGAGAEQEFRPVQSPEPSTWGWGRGPAPFPVPRCHLGLSRGLSRLAVHPLHSLEDHGNGASEVKSLTRVISGIVITLIPAS